MILFEISSFQKLKYSKLGLRNVNKLMEAWMLFLEQIFHIIYAIGRKSYQK